MRRLSYAAAALGVLALLALPFLYRRFTINVSSTMIAFAVLTGADADAHYAATAGRFDAWILSRGFRPLGAEQLTAGMRLEAGSNRWYGGRSNDGRPVTVRLVVWTKALGGSGIRSDVYYSFNGLRRSEPRAAASATALVSEIFAWWTEDQALHPRK